VHHRELGADRRDVADDAIVRVAPVARVDQRQVVHFVARTLAHVLECFTPPENRHGMSSRGAPGRTLMFEV